MIRLFTEQSLKSGARVALDEKQSHYLLHVMRAKHGDDILLFNGKEGEWRGVLETPKKSAFIALQKQTRAQTQELDLWLLFAPIKRGHGDFTVEKAAELGVSKIIPVLTQHTVVSRVPVERYRSIAIEAAEQCERLSVPEILEAKNLAAALQGWDENRALIFCAEAGEAQPIAQVLASLKPGPLAVLVGPEGGFAQDEFNLLRSKKYAYPVRLGPRILRADTAAIAALSLVQALRGDWTA